MSRGTRRTARSNNAPIARRTFDHLTHYPRFARQALCAGTAYDALAVLLPCVRQRTE